MDRQAIQERFGIFGDSPALQRALDRLRQVAPVDITVLFEGPSGVGKELFATALHGLSSRRNRAFVVVNCGAIPEGLIESELFGAERGAYTGSVERRAGFFEEADSGTLFLDEIGEMPMQAQVRLLRVLETGQFSRVGSSKVQTSDVRVVAATNKDLGAEVAAGRFREDLYYRLSAVVIPLPSLAERGTDIVPLFASFLRRFARQYDAPLPVLTPEARALLTQYPWPGNVRELRNVAERTVVLGDRTPVDVDRLRPFLRGVSAGAGLAPRSAAPDDSEGLVYRALLDLRLEIRDLREILLRRGGGEPLPDLPRLPPHRHPGDDEPIRIDEHEVAYEPPDTPRNDDFRVADTDFEIEGDYDGETYDDAGYDDAPQLPETFERVLAEGLPLPSIADAEASLIREALRRYDGNRRQTAEALGISERTLYRKIKDLDDA